MCRDVFGNLREWENIPEQVQLLSRDRTLDEHPGELVRLLRYEGNWKLRELALRALTNLKAPSSEVITEVVNIIRSGEVYWETRVLAIEALRGLFEKEDAWRGTARRELARSVFERLQSLVPSPEPPVLKNSLLKCLLAIQTRC